MKSLVNHYAIQEMETKRFTIATETKELLLVR